jgi:DNA repair exonuclease SbcCD nuclease subunit
MRFIHCADIHLDSPLQGLETYEDAPVEEIRRATRRAFDNLITLAQEEEVDFILIAGDLYDGDWKDYNTGLFFTQRIGRLARAGIRVYIVSGNHDAASRITRSLPLPDNTILFSPSGPRTIILDDLDTAIHGQSYSSRSVTDNLAAGYPGRLDNYFNIGLLHTSLTGREGHENYAPCSMDDLLAAGYDYWALGHVHQREVVSRDPWIIFPGNIQGRHIRETGPKGATLVTVADGRIQDVREHELDVLRWSICEADVSDCSTREEVHARVRSVMENEQDMAGDKTLALRLLLTGSCPLHADLVGRAQHWTEEFRSLSAAIGNVWLEKVQFRTTRRASLENIIGEDSPISGLLQLVASMELGDDTLISLLPDLVDLKAKLPPELLEGNSLLDSSSEGYAELREEIRDLLLARLLRQGDEA